MTIKSIPETGFLRLKQILGTSTTPPLVPVSKTTLWNMVKAGRFPRPIKLSARVTVWKAEDLREYMEKAGGGAK